MRMARLALQPHVGYGLVEGRAVFLDLRRDRYLTLDPAAELAFRRIRSQGELAPAGDGAAGKRLLSTGLFRQVCSDGNLSPVAVPRPPASLLDDTFEARAGWAAPLRAWRAVACARKRLRTTPLIGIVEAILAQRTATRGDSASAEDAARAFLAARAIVPIERSCLLDALALLAWLGDRGGSATLVFGVRMNPFGAHCWLQTDRLLLTDANDAVGALVPVLSV